MLNLSLLSAKPPACENSSLTPPYPTATSFWYPGRGGCTLDLISLLWKLNPRVSEKKNGAGVGVGCGEKYICDVRDKIETGFSVCRRRLREGAKHHNRWIRWVTVLTDSCWTCVFIYFLRWLCVCVRERTFRVFGVMMNICVSSSGTCPCVCGLYRAVSGRVSVCVYKTRR